MQSVIGESRAIGGWLATTLWWGGQYYRDVSEYYFAQRHSFGSNYLLVDGHVDYATYPELIEGQMSFSSESSKPL